MNFTLLGRCVAIENAWEEAEPSVLEAQTWLEARLGQHPSIDEPETPVGPVGPWKLTVRFVADRPEETGLPNDGCFDASGASFWIDGNRVTIVDGHNSFDYQVTEAGAHVVVRGAPFDAYQTLWSIVSESIGCSGLLCLHAAAVERDGRGVLFLGPSGRGKSTTMMTALMAGWRPVAEDSCFFDPRSRTAFAVDRGVRLLDPAYALLRVQHGLEVSEAETRAGKLWLPFESLGRPRCDSVVIRDIVLLRRNLDEPTRWTDASSSEAAMGLWESVGIGCLPSFQRLVAGCLTTAVEGLRAHWLHLGRDPVCFDLLSEA